ncbi:MAG: hypothetical protein JRF59_10165 [Deltaproteobacteria bacterium]|nr:hypothetical protein [Deltaproteobacteria bacterium]
MTSRERVLTALNHEEADRVPLFTFSMDPRFVRAFGNGNPARAYEALGIDAFPIRAQCWCGDMPLVPSLMNIEVPEGYDTGGGVFAGWHGVDEFGRVWEKGSYITGALKTREDLDRFIPPPRLEERTPPAAVRRVMEKYPDRAHVLNAHLGPFGLTMESMGFEHFFYMLYDDRELVREVLDRRTTWFIDLCRHAQELGVDFVVMGDDVAYKGKTFVSPEDFRELAIPCYRRIVEALEIPVIWHSDGFVEPLIQMTLETGIRGMHALEPAAGNDLGRIKERYGDRMVLLGNVDCVSVLTGTDLARVRAEVDRCMAQAKAGGGFMLATSNSLHAACTVEAVREMYRYAMTRPHLPSIPHTAGVKDRCPRFPSDPFPPGGRGRQNVREVSMKRRIVLTTVFLGVLLIISGCAFVNVKTPFDTDLNETTLGSKRGTAEAYSLLWLFSWGDASYAAAAKNGGITVMRHADQELYQVFFGLYTRWRVIVYGD